MKIIYCVALALVKDGNVLLATRPSHKMWGGLWEFPGGKVEAGEVPEDAIVREIKEELSFDIKTKDLIPVGFSSINFDDTHITMLLYMCHNYQGEIIPKEGQEIGFKDIKELDEVEVPPLDKPLLKGVKDILKGVVK